MTTASNLVPFPPLGLVIAIQFWDGDQEQAFRLARLIADIEPARREDVTIGLCGRFDCAKTEELVATWWHCLSKFNAFTFFSDRQATGHPDGCFGLWAGIMDRLSAGWTSGRADAASVFTVEADGAPLRADWLDLLQAEHARSLRDGRRITGALTEYPGCPPHINGSLIAHLSLWRDCSSLRETPKGEAWDLFHAPAILSHARSTPLIKNVYGGSGWSDGALRALARDTAWLSSTKDTSVIEWAERTLVRR